MGVEWLAETHLPTNKGPFLFRVFKDTVTQEEHIVLSIGDIGHENVLMRIHSSCITGECFLSEKCDCGPQLHAAMQAIQKEGRGLIIYLFQEGRGIGLVNKIKAYALQEKGFDTVEANEQLGLPTDARTYDVVGDVLQYFGVLSCRLLTNNPLKIQAVKDTGIDVLERVALEMPTTKYSEKYFHTKQEKMGHMFSNITGTVDEFWMKKALTEAKKCKNTLPNPRVGAVIVKDGRIVGRGYTQEYGGNHSEIQAIHDAKGQTQGATLYVTLEPCCHHGKTPPCTDAIIAAGITKVICAQGIDPNSNVSGKGIKILEQAGIQVLTGVYEDKSRKINEDIELFYVKKRPFVCAKFAVTLDGKIATATGDSKRITSEASRKQTRALRQKYQAILVGKNTVLADNPHLGVREKGINDPLRIVLDSKLETPVDAQVYRDGHVIVATTEYADIQRVQQCRDNGIEVIVCKEKNGRVDIEDLMQKLYEKNITGILIEGGAEVLGSFFDEQLIDKIYTVHAPVLMGGNDSRGAVGGNGSTTIAMMPRITVSERSIVDDDIHTVGYPIYNKI